MNRLHLSYMNLPGNTVSDLRGQRQVSKAARFSPRSLTRSNICRRNVSKTVRNPRFQAESYRRSVRLALQQKPRPSAAPRLPALRRVHNTTLEPAWCPSVALRNADASVTLFTIQRPCGTAGRTSIQSRRYSREAPPFPTRSVMATGTDEELQLLLLLELRRRQKRRKGLRSGWVRSVLATAFSLALASRYTFADTFHRQSNVRTASTSFSSSIVLPLGAALLS